MHLRSAQLTIGALMIAVVIVAGLLDLPSGCREVAAVLSLPCLVLFVAWRLLHGGVALLIDPNPGGASGFVRDKGSFTGPYGCFGPIRGDWWHVALGGGWCYH
jgi:hypothetical protein